MTKEEITTKILQGVAQLRLASLRHHEPVAQLVPPLIAALRVSDSIADAQDTAAEIAAATNDPEGLQAFLATADRLDAADAYKLFDFGTPSMLNRSDIALAAIWLQGTLRDGKWTDFVQPPKDKQ